MNEDKIKEEFEKEFRNCGYSIKRQEAGYIYESEHTEFASRGYESGYKAALAKHKAGDAGFTETIKLTE